jgi:hypothetical protein
MKISKIFTAITLSSVFAFLSSYPTSKISELKAQTLTGRPLAILVNGQGDCCVQDIVSVGNYLNSINAEVYISPWNSSLLIPLKWNVNCINLIVRDLIYY